MAPDIEIAGEAFETQPVSLALVAEQVRVGLAHDDVHDVGKLPDDLRQGAQGVLDALVRRKQPERQQHLLADYPELILEVIRIGERHVRDAVGDQVDLGGRGLVDVAQEL